MEDTILDLCRRAKAEQHRTLKEIAEGAGVPLNTVTNYFSRDVKAPTYDTIAPICAYLGVSMDAHAGMTPPTAGDPALLSQLHERDIHIAHLEGRLEQLELVAAEAKLRQKHTAFLMAFSAIMIVALSAYIAWDATMKNAGLIQGGSISVFALLLVAVVVATAATMGKMLVQIIRSAGRGQDEAPKG